MNIYGDIAGQYDAFKRLRERMPKGVDLCVGDLVDRGPKSREVIEYCMDEGILSLMGNHENMFIDFYQNGDSPDALYYLECGGHSWLLNGGDETLSSYGCDSLHSIYEKIPENHIRWLMSLPFYYQSKEDRLLVTHAPVSSEIHEWQGFLDSYGLPKMAVDEFLWNRFPPKDRTDEGISLQVFGHNAMWGFRRFINRLDLFVSKPWGICLDSSHQKLLTGLHVESGEVFQEPY